PYARAVGGDSRAGKNGARMPAARAQLGGGDGPPAAGFVARRWCSGDDAGARTGAGSGRAERRPLALRAPSAHPSHLGALDRQPGEVRLPGHLRPAEALLEWQYAVGIDIALELRPECLPRRARDLEGI